jgi:hypothetical protein
MNSLSITLIPGLNGGASLASAHGGGVDGQGGHNNRSAGNYHFHRGPLDGRTFASKEDAAKVLPAYSPGAANEAGSDSHRSTEPLFFDLAPYRPYQSSDSQVIAHKARIPSNTARPISRRPGSSTASPPSNYRPALVALTTSVVMGRSLQGRPPSLTTVAPVMIGATWRR